MAEQTQLLTYIKEAITVIEERYKRQPSPLEIQAYLYAEYQIVESLESVKRNGDIVLELRRQALPIFHEHEDDHLIPPGYGIDESHDGGFYPYTIVGDDHDDMEVHSDHTQIIYMPYEDTGFDKRFTSYTDALRYIQERTANYK